MSLRRYKAVFLKIYNDLDRKFIISFAAALSFYFLLSLFPLLIFLASAMSYVPVPNLFDQIVSLMARVMPGEAMGLVERVLSDILGEQRGGLLSLGIVVTVWAASLGFHAMLEALNVAYEVEEGRPYWKRRLLAIGMTFGVGALVVVALTAMALGPQFGYWLTDRVGLSPQFAAVWPYLRWSIAVLFTVLAVELIYYVGPNVRQKFHCQLPGAALAVLIWIGASYALGLYVRNFADYNATYGALGAVIALMMWLFISATAILLGAEFNQALLKTGGERLDVKEHKSEEELRAEREAEEEIERAEREAQEQKQAEPHAA